MKKCFSLFLCLVTLFMLSPLSAKAIVHKQMTWETLSEASTFVEPFTDYTSVFDKTQEKYLFSEYEKDLLALQQQFPDLMKLEIAGYSELGRPLYVVVMGKDTAPNRMFILANAHAREYTGTQLSVLQIEFYLNNYYNTINGERVCDLFERCQYYFLPMFNPDGAMLSMLGLDSLDEPGLTVTPEDKAEIEKFLLTQVDEMNAACELDGTYHDTDAAFYSDNPDPEHDDAFQYWKNNIRGIDLHYNMYTPWMMERWKDGSLWYMNNADSHFTAPSWQNFAGYDENSGISTTENIALEAYINKVKPSIFITYHTASNIVQWDYGYDDIENGAALRKNAQNISARVGVLLNFGVYQKRNPHLGHTGWFMKNSTNYMDTCGYGAVVELANRYYLDNVDPEVGSYTDAPPTKIIQLTEDVQTITGVQRYSLWTTGKFFPLALSQYIMDNQLLEAPGPLTGDPNAEVEITSILGNPVTAPAAAEILDFGTFQLPRAEKTTVIPGDILTNGFTPFLYNTDEFSKTVDFVEIKEATKVYFSYTDSNGKEIRASFTAEPFGSAPAEEAPEKPAETPQQTPEQPASSSGISPAVIGIGAAVVILAAVCLLVIKKRKKN